MRGFYLRLGDENEYLDSKSIQKLTVDFECKDLIDGIAITLSRVVSKLIDLDTAHFSFFMFGSVMNTPFF